MTAPERPDCCPDHPMPAGCATEVIDVGSYYGQPEAVVDEPHVNKLLAAAFDQCVQCQSRALDAIDGQPVTVASLLDRALYVVIQAFGGVPSFLADPTSSVGYSTALRVAVGAATAFPGGPVAMFRVIESYPPAERRVIALDALHILVGYLLLGPGSMDKRMTAGRPAHWGEQPPEGERR